MWLTLRQAAGSRQASGETLKDIGVTYGVSRQAVRTFLARAASRAKAEGREITPHDA